MTAIPSKHNIGDTGHAADHNAIVDILTAHDQSITALGGVTTGIFYTTGNNTSNITGTNTPWARVNLPTGNRDSAVDTLSFFHGSNKIFWLDGYSHPRVKNDDPTHIPWVVDAVSGQTAHLEEWRVNGTAKAWIGADGAVNAPNIQSGPWTNISLSSGLIPYGHSTHTPQYRITNDLVEMRGVVGKSSGPFSATPVVLGTLPVGARPTALSYNVCASTFISYDWSVRTEVSSSGVITAYLDTANGYQPTWISLENFRFSTLPD